MPEVRPLGPDQQFKVLSADFERRSKRRTVRQARAVVTNTAIAGILIGAAQALKTHPDAIHQAVTAFPQIPQALSEGATAVQNAVVSATDTIGNTVDKVGNFVTSIPIFGWGPYLVGRLIDAAPHALANANIQTPFEEFPLKEAIGERGIMAGELLLVEEGIRRVGRQIVRNGEFKRDNSRMGYVDNLGFSIVHGKAEIQSSSWAKLLTMGDPRGDAEGILKDPTNFWNKRRIGHIIEHAVSQAVAADKKGRGMSSILNASVLTQAGGEVLEQTAKLSVAHVAGILGSAIIGGITWAAYFGYSIYSAIKTGSPEKIKIALEAFFPTVVPTLSVVTGPLFGIPAEISQHKYDKKVGEEFIAGIDSILRKDPRRRTPTEYNALLMVSKAFDRNLPRKIRKKGAAKKVGDIAIGLEGVLQDLSPAQNRNNNTYTETDSKVKNLEGKLVQDIATMNELEQRGLLYRFLHPIRMRKLANKISKQHAKMYALMMHRYDKFDHAYQIAATLNGLFKNSGYVPSPGVTPNN